LSILQIYVNDNKQKIAHTENIFKSNTKKVKTDGKLKREVKIEDNDLDEERSENVLDSKAKFNKVL
jgi:hypothetical protein